MEIKKNTIFIIVGPTAVGKTAFAIELAQHFNTEIISADSRQCYKELNIGVAKPSEEELKTVHHYFINSHSIDEDVNAGSFEQYALQAAEKIFKKNNIAVMVGGTGLYIKAFCEGMDEMPAINKDIRNRIVEQYEQDGLVWLQQQVQQKDPEFWKIAEQQNPQRLMRALEIVEQTGKSIASFRKKNMVERNFNILKIGLELPREILYKRINDRVDIMMQQGLYDEAYSLFPYKDINALQTVGYSEIFKAIEEKNSLAEAVEEIKKNTRHYAKRQMTWFKKDASVSWINALDKNILEKAIVLS